MTWGLYRDLTRGYAPTFADFRGTLSADKVFPTKARNIEKLF